MAWTNPRTWVAGEIVTAALLNTHLRDNLLAITANAGLETVTGATATADLTLSSTVTLVPGLSITMSGSGVNTIYVVNISLDVDMVVNTTAAAQLFVDGSPTGPTLICVLPSGSRVPMNKTIVVTGLAAGSHTFQARANLSGATGTIIRQTHSTMSVDVRA